MPLERAELTVDPGDAAAFAAMMADRALPLLRALPGVGSVAFGQGVEDPAKFLLLIDWATLAAHEAFKTMPVYRDFRALLAPFTRHGIMEHFAMTGPVTIGS